MWNKIKDWYFTRDRFDLYSCNTHFMVLFAILTGLHTLFVIPLVFLLVHAFILEREINSKKE